MLLAVVAAVSGTAVDVAPHLGFFAALKANAISGLVGLGAFALFPVFWKLVKAKLIPALVGWQMAEVKKVMADTSGDPAIAQFKKDQVLAFAKLAKAKFPQGGLGPERKKYVIDLLVNKVPLFKGQEDHLNELIDQVVAAEKGVLDAIQPAA